MINLLNKPRLFY